MADHNSLGLESRRTAAGISRAEFARRVGIDYATAWRWERRGRPPAYAEKAIAAALAPKRKRAKKEERCDG